MLKVNLVVVGGATEGDEFQLELPAIMGRSREVSIPLPHPLVSRRHCELFERDGSLFVNDLGSTNGTFVGSDRVISATVIEHGALLTIGTVTLRAFYDGLPTTFASAEESDASAPQQSGNANVDTSTILRTDTGGISAGKLGIAPPRMGQKAK